MNLALLDPFRRQLPDRIDSTLTLPRELHLDPSSTGGGGNADGGVTSGTGRKQQGGGTGKLTKKKQKLLEKQQRQRQQEEEEEERRAAAAGDDNDGPGSSASPPPETVGGAEPEREVAVGDDEVPTEDEGANPATAAAASTTDEATGKDAATGDGGNGEDGGPTKPAEEEGRDWQSSAAAAAAATAKKIAAATSVASATPPPPVVVIPDHELLPCLRVSFNRRGTYLAVGHASGAVAVWDYLSRTLVALYPPTTIPPTPSPPSETVEGTGFAEAAAANTATTIRYVTSLSWSRRGRTLLVHSRGDRHVKRVDLSAPDPDYYVLHHHARAAAERGGGGGGGGSVSAESSSLSTTANNGGVGGGGGGGRGRPRSPVLDPTGCIATVVSASGDDLVSTVPTTSSSSGGPSGGRKKQQQKRPTKSGKTGKDAPGGGGGGAAATGGDAPPLDPGSTVLLPVRIVSIPRPVSCSGTGGSAEAMPPPETSTGGRKRRRRQRRGRRLRLASSGRVVSSQVLALPRPTCNILGCRVHPRDDATGVACLDDGSMVLFHFPPFHDEGGGVGHTDDREEDDGGIFGDPGGGGEFEGVPRRSRGRYEGRVMYLVPPGGYAPATAEPASPEAEGEGTPPPAVTRAPLLINSAIFDHDGTHVYAITTCGTLLGFEMSPAEAAAPSVSDGSEYAARCAFECPTQPSTSTDSGSTGGGRAGTRSGRGASSTSAPGGADASDTDATSAAGEKRRGGGGKADASSSPPSSSAGGGRRTVTNTHEITYSRHGDLLLVNCLADGTLKLYNAKLLLREARGFAKDHGAQSQSSTRVINVKPRHVFSDLVNPGKTIFYSADFSGDGEHLVGGCNSPHSQGDKYELYVWNTTTGELLDRLTGPQCTMYSVAWHPTRSFIAVGTGDGLVDVWGPRMDWTAFAPDFQALHMNVEYVEREDEFDVVVDDDDEEERRRMESLLSSKKEREEVADVVSIERVPVFDSDSESESEVFSFRTKVKGLMSLGRGRSTAKVVN